jgi:hypothetical protein
VNPIRRRRLGGKVYPYLAAQFDLPSTQNLFISNAAQVGLNPGTSDFAVSFWAKPASSATNLSVFGKGAIANTATLAPGYYIFLTATTLRPAANFCDNANASTVSYVATTGGLTVGAWGHVVLNFSRAGNVQAFTNNVALSTASIATRAGSCTPAANFAIGSTCRNDTLTYSAYFDGTLDMVGFWLRTLSTDEIAALYNQGMGLATQDLPSGLRASLSSYWDFDGNFRDGMGTNPLAAATASPTFGPGKR